MLRALRLFHWKSFDDDHHLSGRGLRFAPLSLMVGPNASGKSNVLDAIRFLQGAALDFPLGDVLRGRWEGQREIWGGIRGQLAEAPRSSHVAPFPAFAIESEWLIGARSLTHSIGVEISDDALLTDELLTDGSKSDYLFNTHAPAVGANVGRTRGGGISAALRRQGRGRNPTLEFLSSRSLLGQIEESAVVDPNVVACAHAVRSEMRGATFLDIQPARMRDYRPLAGPHLGTSGENISPVLASLDPSRLGDVVDWLSELCAPGIESIEFDRTMLKETMLFLVEKGGHKISARSMSDGTLRFLGEVTALLTAPPGTLMLLEEPDVGLHPSRIHLLARLLEHVTRPGGIQVIATTHSPTLLAHLSQTAFDDVLAMARDPESGETVSSRIGDLPNADVLRKSDHVERLISTGWLERAL